MEKATMQDINVICVKNYNDEDIFAIELEEKRIYLNSKYDTSDFVNIWCNQHDISNPFTICVVYGVSDGRYIQRLREINKDMLIIVFEPSETITEKAKQLRLYKLDEKMMIITSEESLGLFSNIIGNAIDFANSKYVRFFVSPNYEKIYSEGIETVKEIVFSRKRKVDASSATVNFMKDKFNKNIAENFIDRIYQHSLYDLVEKLKTINKENVPAIIVAAGPSLDKNINYLRQAKGKAFIIAVDTALNALDKVDIIPDISITIDPKKSIELFTSKKMENVPMIVHLLSNSEIMEHHHGKRFYQDSKSTICDIFMNKYKKKKMFLETGGSVANDACSLACYAGFKTIIFVGQDLAYPNDQEHANNTFGKDHNNYITDNGKTYFFIEDIYGNQVKTEYNMNSYRLWFENEIRIHKDIRFIDATEGGAKIHGTEIMTLNDAISKTCNRNEKVDFFEIIDSIEAEFDETQKMEILAYISNYENVIKDIKRKLRDGIKVYRDLAQYNRKNVYSGKGFDTTYKKISELNYWVSDDPEIAFMTDYMSERKYEMLGQAYEKKDSIYDEIKFIVDNGIDSLETLIKCTDDVLKDYCETIEKAKELYEEFLRNN